MDPELKKEVTALAAVLDEMDYYQILKLKPTAFSAEIKTAYFNQSRVYHPDKYYNEPPEVVEKINRIFKRLAEAYGILSDNDKRVAYSRAISGPDRKKYLRYDPKTIGQAKSGGQKEDEGQTAMGKNYYRLAKSGIQNKDYNSAKINLQLAAKMEPNNQTFKQKLAEVDEIIKLRKQQKAGR
jgi:curved DNA-binding protein CbpA